MRPLFILLFLMRLCISFCFADDAPSIHIPPRITLRVEEFEAFEGKEIPLYISIDHLNEDVIDPSSFTLNDSPLEVRLIGSQMVGPSSLFKSTDPNTMSVSLYKAALSPMSSGVYTVGPVFVSLSGVVYQSNSITFNVLEATVSKNFTLTSTIEAPSAIYPGQKIKVSYFLSFPDKIQIVHEKLPLLELEDFQPLGAATSVITATGENQFLETLSREYKATTSGSFLVEPAVIEGMRYYMVQDGEKVLLPPLMRAKDVERELRVLFFPAEDKPAFFAGALGSYTWRGRIIGSNKVKVDSPIEVEWRVTGRGDMDTVTLPPLRDNPLFASRFFFEGEPKETREDEGTKSYRVLLRPKTQDVKEIPAFWFSSFDPLIKKYITGLTLPLPLEVEANENEATKSEPSKKPSMAMLPFDPLLLKKAPDESPLTLNTVWYIAIALALIGFVEKKTVEGRRLKQQARTSRDLYYEAFRRRAKRQEGLTLLKEALLLRLFETSLIQTKDQSVESLSNEGLVGEAKRVLQDINITLYGKNEAVQSVQKIWDEAALVFQMMKTIKTTKEEAHE